MTELFPKEGQEAEEDDSGGHNSSGGGTYSSPERRGEEEEETEAEMMRSRTSEGTAAGNSSQSTAKWSYRDHPVSTMPRNDVGRPWPPARFSRWITSSQDR